MIIAATNDTDVNIQVFNDAEARGMLVNVVDVPPLCNFILPAITRSGPIAIAISTAGASPALAKRMKSEIGEAVRRRLRGPRRDPQRRARLGEGNAARPTTSARHFFEEIVNGDPDPIVLLREGRADELHALIETSQRETEARLAAQPA